MGITVLLVDDAPSMIAVTSEMLMSLPSGAFVIVAVDGKSGLESFKKYNPDVVLSDITMPDMDGVQMLKEIRRLDCNVPVILMSGYTGYDMGEMKAAGMTSFLPKPFNMEELKTSIMEAMGQ